MQLALRAQGMRLQPFGQVQTLIKGIPAFPDEAQTPTE